MKLLKFVFKLLLRVDLLEKKSVQAFVNNEDAIKSFNPKSFSKLD